MDLTTDVKALKDALATIKPAVPSRYCAIPVLAGAHLVAAGGKLTLTTTDLDLTMTTSIDADVRLNGKALVPHKLLHEAVGKSKGSIALTLVNDETFAAVNGIANKLRPYSLADYPKLSSRPDLVRLPLDVEALASVLPAASTEDSRPILTGVLFGGGENRDELVATDSYRLHLVRGATYPKTLVPARAIAAVLKSAKSRKGWLPAAVTFDEKHAWFETNGVTIMTRLIEGEFPNYRQLIPSSYPVHMQVEKDQFRQAITAVKTFVRDSTTPVRLDMLPTEVKLSVKTQEVGESEVTIPAAVTGLPTVFGPLGEVPYLRTSFNPVYLLEGSDVPGDMVTMGVVDSLKPALIEATDDDGRLHRRLIMPVRTP